MSWDRTIDLYLDVAKQATGENPLLSVDGSSWRAGGLPVFVVGDHLTLRLAFVSFSSGVMSRVEVPAGAAIVFAAKSKADLVTGDVLFAAADFTASGTGETLLYEAQLDLNTAELVAALTTASLDVRCDVEVQNADNSRRITLQFDAVARLQVYDDGAALPLPVDAPRAFRIDDGELQLWNPDQSKWHSVYIRGAVGAEHLVIAGGVE